MREVPTHKQVKDVCDRLDGAFQSGNDDRMLEVIDEAVYMIRALIETDDTRMLTYSAPQFSGLLMRLSATRSA